MIKLAVPFLLSEPKQIPNSIKGKDFFLEGIVFDANLFIEDTYWEKIENSIIFLSKKFPNQLYSLHFPVNNADYLTSPKVKEYLYKFIDLAFKHNISVIVLHSNSIELLETFNIKSLAKKRARYLAFFKKLDLYLLNKKLKICIENMPIVGNSGEDVDCIFVLPKDFKKLNFNNIKITWDIGHWAYTWSVLKSLTAISPYIKTTKVQFNEFLKLRRNLAHFQFSSFRTIALPGTNSVCVEGVVPMQGDIDEKLLQNVLHVIYSWKEQYVMSLEIQDEDYAHRVNLLKTINWIENVIFHY
ncbi:hypothetical protein C4577_00680 [Candidatus Parcubacteria bacterium]|nr:MAG: hypothetical protein C4577_00680 [Candidatus Parcubacteria bacterium]